MINIKFPLTLSIKCFVKNTWPIRFDPKNEVVLSTQFGVEMPHRETPRTITVLTISKPVMIIESRKYKTENTNNSKMEFRSM